MKKKLRIGFSPCPNDTFIFHALVHGLIECPFDFEVILADVEELNTMAQKGLLDVCKVSVHAAGKITDDWLFLRSGGAMGKGVGPLLVTRKELLDKGQENIFIENLSHKNIISPGKNTTAHLLFSLFAKEKALSVNMREQIFHEIIPALQNKQAEAGIIIHEGRFTYEQAGLAKVQDLGQWWERKYSCPLPLGLIAIQRKLGSEIAEEVNRCIKKSVQYAWQNPQESKEYIAQHAQELAEEIQKEHIKTFVTKYSEDIGEDGENAIKILLTESYIFEGKIKELPIKIFV